MGNSTRSSRRSFMGTGARRGAELAVEMAGLAAGLKPVAKLADVGTLAPEAPPVLTRTDEHIDIIDRRDPSGRTRLTARSTSELLRRRGEGAIVDGPALAMALAWGLGFSWQRARSQGQPPAASMDYAVSTIRAAVVGQPSVDVMLERMSGLATAAASGDAEAAGSRLAAEADRLASDIASRHRSVAEQGARRFISAASAACDVLLVGDGSRTIGGGVGTTTAVVGALAGLERLGAVYVMGDDTDAPAAAWMMAELAGAGIDAASLSTQDAEALIGSRPALRVLLATAIVAPGGQVRVPATSVELIQRHADRVLALASAFGERAPEPTPTQAERWVVADSVAG